MGAELAIPNTTVVAGDTLRGNFRFKFDIATPFTSVSLKLVGKEISRLHVNPPKGSSFELGRINVHKQYISILGGPKGSNFKGELPPGDYDFPFEFQIPLDAPPSCSVGAAGRVEYYVQGCFSNDKLPVTKPITIVTHMSTSQYLTKAPVESTPSHFDRALCCCMDLGRTEIQVKLPQNIYIYGKDQSISGTITINNSESKAACQEVGMRLMRVAVKRLYGADGKFEKEVRDTEFYPGLHEDVIGVDIAPGEQQPKQYSFVLPLVQNSKLLSTCYNGPGLQFYYELAVAIDFQYAHSVPIVIASGEDTDNRCPFIDMTTPHLGMRSGSYPKSVYPHGQVAGVVMPQQPPGNIPQPMSTGLSYESVPRGNGAVGGAAQGDVYGGGIYDQGVGVDIYGAHPSNHAPLLDTDTGTSAFPDI